MTTLIFENYLGFKEFPKNINYIITLLYILFYNLLKFFFKTSTYVNNI